jgi:hypothetical protein
VAFGQTAGCQVVRDSWGMQTGRLTGSAGRTQSERQESDSQMVCRRAVNNERTERQTDSDRPKEGKTDHHINGFVSMH